MILVIHHIPVLVDCYVDIILSNDITAAFCRNDKTTSAWSVKLRKIVHDVGHCLVLDRVTVALHIAKLIAALDVQRC